MAFVFVQGWQTGQFEPVQTRKDILGLKPYSTALILYIIVTEKLILGRQAVKSPSPTSCSVFHKERTSKAGPVISISQ
jgi:hypothetical protein